GHFDETRLFLRGNDRDRCARKRRVRHAGRVTHFVFAGLDRREYLHRIGAGGLLVVCILTFARALLHDRHVVALVVRSLPIYCERTTRDRLRRWLDRRGRCSHGHLRLGERGVRLCREIAHFVFTTHVRRAHLDRAALRRVLVRAVLLVRCAGFDDRDEVPLIVGTLPRDLDLRARGRCLRRSDRSRHGAHHDRTLADEHVAGAEEVTHFVLARLVGRRQLHRTARLRVLVADVRACGVADRNVIAIVVRAGPFHAELCTGSYLSRRVHGRLDCIDA